jgi:hypothetical protein
LRKHRPTVPLQLDVIASTTPRVCKTRSPARSLI